MVMQKASPEYRFDVKGPEDATLSKFLKPLADISIKARGGSVQ